jgi:hypothetical protein
LTQSLSENQGKPLADECFAGLSVPLGADFPRLLPHFAPKEVLSEPFRCGNLSVDI